MHHTRCVKIAELHFVSGVIIPEYTTVFERARGCDQHCCCTAATARTAVLMVRMGLLETMSGVFVADGSALLFSRCRKGDTAVRNAPARAAATLKMKARPDCIDQVIKLPRFTGRQGCHLR